MGDPVEGEKSLAEIQAALSANGTYGPALNELIELVRDGMRWHKAAAAESEVEAAKKGWYLEITQVAIEQASGHSTPPGDARDSRFMGAALQAAAAHRDAHGEDVEALKAELELTQVSHQNVVAENEALKAAWFWEIIERVGTPYESGAEKEALIYFVQEHGMLKARVAELEDQNAHLRLLNDGAYR